MAGRSEPAQGPVPVAGGETPTSSAADADRSATRKRRRRRRRRKAQNAPGPGASNPTIPGERQLRPAQKPAAAKGPGGQAPDAAARAPVPEHSGRGPGQEPQGRPRQFGGQPRRGPLYAALDLGTNNCRLLVATPTAPGQFRVVDAFSRIVRLGEGLTHSGRLSDAAMDRAIEALRVCAVKLASREIRRLRLIATEACRAAANGGEFLERVRIETGLVLEIVDRETEARLAVCGCGSLVEREIESVVLFDIGGGSSEIALVDLNGERSNRLSDHISAWTSLPVGVVSLAERFGGRDVSGEHFEAMVTDVTAHIDEFANRHGSARERGGARFHLLGTSGTVTTLAGIHLGLERYDRRRVDGVWMHDSEVTAMTERLLSWDFDTRVANPCIGPDRADLVLAGCAILEAIRRTWPSERLRVADRGLREGILTELMYADGAWRRRRRNRGGRRP
ncbi:MAG: Ppx/GppA family phosphatase [Brucellaceae bacterium]|nr:Ppx/GppA family phosphatase [Brucellaceae bacterium]